MLQFLLTRTYPRFVRTCNTHTCRAVQLNFKSTIVVDKNMHARTQYQLYVGVRMKSK